MARNLFHGERSMYAKTKSLRSSASSRASSLFNSQVLYVKQQTASEQ